MGKLLVINPGDRFGRLVVQSRSPVRHRHGNVRYHCTCDCGTDTVVIGSLLVNGSTASCGCLKRELTSARNTALLTTHGQTNSRAYYAYHSAKQRCCNPDRRNYHSYGGRGIKFLYASFEQFLADLGHPAPGMTLDRINNNGNYEPGNCRWATMREQENNKRSNVRVALGGRTQTQSQWARELGISPSTVSDRINARGWDVERALTTPVRPHQKQHRGSQAPGRYP